MHRNFAMASVTSAVQVFHSGSREDFVIVKDLERKCAKFCKKQISLEYNQFDNWEQWLSRLTNMNENNPTMFLVSRALLDTVWCTQYKKDILEFMLKPKTLIVFMNVPEECVRMYSTELLQKNVTKRSASAIFSSTPEDLELYFTNKLLAEVNEKAQVPYCIQNEKLIPVMNKFPEDLGQKKRNFGKSRRRQCSENEKFYKETKKKNIEEVTQHFLHLPFS